MTTTGCHAMSGLTCRDARGLFDAHLDGELSPAMETELNAHRVSCAACRQELALLEVAGQVVRSDDAAPALHDDFTARLLSCIAAKPKARWKLPFADYPRIVRLGLRGLAAAACVALAVGYLNRPAERVAGVRHVNPKATAQPSRNTASSGVVQSPVSEEQLQAQLERALTGWRKDASSLKKVYDFITPQIVEEMGLDRGEGIHETRELFKPAAPPTPGETGDDPEIEDI